MNSDLWLFGLLIWGVVTVFSLVGCKSRDPNPHLSDLIYQDIQKEVTGLGQLEDETEKKIENAEKELAKSEPRTIERKNAANDLQKQQDRLIQVHQMFEYYKLRLGWREIQAKRKYIVFFEKDQEWPDRTEFAAYLENKKLNMASRSWSDRVPKTANPGVPPKDGAKPKESKSEEGGAEGPKE